MLAMNGSLPMTEDRAPVSLSLKASPEVVACEFGEGIALLHLKSNVYYSLNSVGADIWEFIQSPSSKDEICKYIEEKFQIKKEVCRSDIEKIISEFEKYNLLASP